MSNANAPTVGLVRCAECGKIDTPHRIVCSGCLSGRLEAYQASGRGVIASWTMIRRAPAGFKDEAPYAVVVVDLDGGMRITGRLDSRSPPAAIGARAVAVRSDRGGAVFSVEPQ